MTLAEVVARVGLLLLLWGWCREGLLVTGTGFRLMGLVGLRSRDALRAQSGVGFFADASSS